MSIFSRTRDIFAANMTDLLDRAEDPARMIRMIILEMEETLVEVAASAARCIADGKEMRRAVGRLEDLQLSWTEKPSLPIEGPRGPRQGGAGRAPESGGHGKRAQGRACSIDDTLKAYETDIASSRANCARRARARMQLLTDRKRRDAAKAREVLGVGRTEDAFSRFEVLDAPRRLRRGPRRRAWHDRAEKP
jgi:phage shock protein A